MPLLKIDPWLFKWMKSLHLTIPSCHGRLSIFQEYKNTFWYFYQKEQLHFFQTIKKKWYGALFDQSDELHEICINGLFDVVLWAKQLVPSHVSVNILFMIKRLFSPYETKSIEITTISWCEIYCFGTMMSVHPIFLYLNAYNI